MSWFLLVQAILMPSDPEAWIAVFRRLIEQQTFSQAEYLCLGVVEDREAWELGDVSPGIIQEFAQGGRRVVPVSECRMSVDGNTHVRTGAIAQIYLIESSRVSGLSGEVRAIYHLNGVMGGRLYCAVLKGPDGWEAICHHISVF